MRDELPDKTFGGPPPQELLKYLKKSSEYNSLVIRRSAVTVQHDRSSECGSLCLYMLKQLSRGVEFSVILSRLAARYENKKSASGLSIQI